MPPLHCPRCGGALISHVTAPNLYQCTVCGKEIPAETASKNLQELRRALGEANAAMVNNLRKNLYTAVTAKYISREEVLAAAEAIRRYLPEDFLANFFKVASNGNLRLLNKAINEIDTEAHMDDVGLIIEFLVRSMTADEDCLLALNCLVERAYKQRNLGQYSRYATMISTQAEKVLAGVYETILPRDVFVAYSSKDMSHVTELVETLEEQGFSCFVAARNLRHGIGSVENYDRALREAMDNCRTVVFVSSMNSRSVACDALRVELSYVKQSDMAAAPVHYRNNYEAIPHACKKPRVEYRVEESNRPNPADRIVAQFFAGYERVYSAEDVVNRIMDQLFDAPNPWMADVGMPEPIPAPTPVPRYSEGLEFELTEDGTGYAVTDIGECTDTDLVIPEEYEGVPVTEIADEAFNRQEQLTGVTIPESVTTIGDGAFGYCTGLTSLTVSPRNTVYQSINNCVIETDTRTLVAGCKNSVIPESVTIIGENAFCGCVGLTAIMIPEGVTNIEAEAFMDCTALSRIVIPEGVTSIGSDTFLNCESLSSITLPSSVTCLSPMSFFNGSSWRDCDTNPFVGCSGLTSLRVSPKNPKFHSANNCIIETATGALIVGCRNSTIPAGVTCLRYLAFAGCTELTKITIPVSVKRIEDEVFSDTTLTELYFKGTEAQWNAIEKDECWDDDTPAFYIYCNG